MRVRIELTMVRKAGFEETATRHFLPSMLIVKRLGPLEADDSVFPRELYEKILKEGKAVVRGEQLVKSILETMGVKLDYLENTSIVQARIEKTTQ